MSAVSRGNQSTDRAAVHPSRRALARTALWAVPSVAVATAAPAYAFSCSDRVGYSAPFNASGYKRDPTSGSATSNTSGTGTARSTTVGATAVTYKVSSSPSSTTTLTVPNLSTAGDSQSGYNGRGDLATEGLEVVQTGTSNSQAITFTFSRQVSNLQFTVADIDADATDYSDNVWFSPSPFSVNNASGVSGAGTSASPLIATTKSPGDSSNTANRSLVTLTGPLTSFTVTFFSGDKNGTTVHQIFLRGMTFTSSGC